MPAPLISHLGEFCTTAMPAALVVLTLAALLLASYPPRDAVRELTLRFLVRWWFAAAFTFLFLLFLASLSRTLTPDLWATRPVQESATR